MRPFVPSLLPSAASVNRIRGTLPVVSVINPPRTVTFRSVMIHSDRLHDEGGANRPFYHEA